MAPRLFFLAIVLTVSTPVFGESADTAWVRQHNGQGNSYDRAYAMAMDDSGNVCVTGHSWYSGTSDDYVTIKYHSSGNLLWLERYNGPGNGSDVASAIAIDGSGYFYVTGRSTGTAGDEDYATIKYYPHGDTCWVRRYNGPSGNFSDEAYALAVDDSGCVYVTGGSIGSGTYDDYATVKYYPNGDTAWARRYDAGGNWWGENGSAIAVDSFGNVYVTGWSYGSVTSQDYATIKYYPDGDTAWLRRYNGPGNNGDGANAIALDRSGNVYVTGVSHGGGTHSDYATVKYDSAGNQLYVRRYNGPGNNNDAATAIVLDDSGNVYVTGKSVGSGTYDDYATVKYDSSLKELWVKRYNGPGSSADGAVAIALDDSANIYVTGCSWGSGNLDYATVKYDSSGNELWVERYNGPGNGSDYAYGIALDDSDNVYVTGYVYGGGSSDDYATIKYVQFLCGDVNNDGVVNVGDAIYILNYLFKHGPEPVPSMCVGDVNNDDVVNVGDAIHILNYLFKGGPPPSC